MQNTLPTPFCILLDRDGTLMVDKHYLHDPAGVELLPGAAAGLRLLQQAGCTLLVLTNQSGIGRGYFDVAALNAVNQRFCDLLAAEGVTLPGIWHCPHAPTGSLGDNASSSAASLGDAASSTQACTCRKPAPGLAFSAAAELDGGSEGPLTKALRAGRVVSVGDKWSDVTLGQKLGGRGVLVLTGKGQEQLRKNNSHPQPKHSADFVAADMLDAALWIVHNSIL